MNEVAYQDEVVAVLKKSIQGADVSWYDKIDFEGVCGKGSRAYKWVHNIITCTPNVYT